eukprot:Awhi_evm1s6438
MFILSCQIDDKACCTNTSPVPAPSASTPTTDLTPMACNLNVINSASTCPALLLLQLISAASYGCYYKANVDNDPITPPPNLPVPVVISNPNDIGNPKRYTRNAR